jgi:cupin superfamily acireductone dioxygenase involved in methionine salvage
MILLKTREQIKEEINQAYEINELIHPNFAIRLESLTFNPHLDHLIKQSDTKPLDHVAKQAIFNSLPPIVQHLASSAHFDLIPTKVAKIKGSDLLEDEHLRQRLERSKIPHINHGREMHVFLQGRGRFEMKASSGDNVSLVVEAGDVLYIAPSTEHSFYLELDNGDVSESFMIASFHEEEFDRFHKRVEYLPSSSSSS